MNNEKSDEQVINPNVIQEAQHLLRQYFANPCEIKSVTFLSEPDRRNVVLRLYLENKSDDIPISIILKQSLPEATDDDDK